MWVCVCVHICGHTQHSNYMYIVHVHVSDWVCYVKRSAARYMCMCVKLLVSGCGQMRRRDWSREHGTCICNLPQQARNTCTCQRLHPNVRLIKI